MTETNMCSLDSSRKMLFTSSSIDLDLDFMCNYIIAMECKLITGVPLIRQ